MSRIFQSVFLLLCGLALVSCNQKSYSTNSQTLSNDFDKSPPFYFKMPKQLSAEDTSPSYKQKGEKILLTGTVYQIDGKTPASNIILYYYQTDINGVYSTKENEERNMPKNKLGQTHGYIRGWVRTDEQGAYSIYTTRPGAYPNRQDPAHIHLSVKEDLMEEPYYLDNFVFDDDPLLNSSRRQKMENRGGSGVIRFVEKGGLKIGERNIVLGLKIPDYPKKDSSYNTSGRSIGEDVISFTPFHAFGADKGTKTCPVCKYGWYYGILYFVGNHPNWSEITEWLLLLEKLSKKQSGYLKVFFVYGNEANYDRESRQQELQQLGASMDLEQVALTFVPSFKDESSEVHFNQINPEAENTFLIYKRSSIIDKYIDLKPSEENFRKIKNKLTHSTNQYFKLPKVKRDSN